MQLFKLATVLAFAATVAGCTAPSTDAERAVVGALAGAVIADTTENDVLTGALIGAGAGVFCDDLNVPVPGCI
jgi:osmotically inducible lipoprotein OsmB